MKPVLKLIVIASLLFLAPCTATAQESTRNGNDATLDRRYKPFKKLTDVEIEAFFKVYKEDPEPCTKGGFQRGWIIGEAPLVQKQPLAHFPMRGRLNTRGVLAKGKGGDLDFTTKLRTYVIRDRYFIHKLGQVGFRKKDDPRSATIDAYWINIEDGGKQTYTLLHFHSIKLHPVQTDPEASFRSLFDGVSLQGWQRGVLPRGHIYNGGHWAVDSGSLVASRLVDDRRGGWLQTNGTFDDFDLELDVRPDWGCDTGVLLRQNDEGAGIQITIDYREGGNVGFIHGQGSGNYYTRPFSLRGVVKEGQLVRLTAENHYDARQRDGLIHACTSKDFLKAWKINDWNRIRVRCVGKHPNVTIWINGLKTCEMESESFKARHPLKPEIPTYDPKHVHTTLGDRGRIGLQIHPGKNWSLPDGEVRFQNIRIRSVAVR